MTELCTAPFIKDKEYLMTHDLCDIPGLSEYQSNEENAQKQVEKKEEANKNSNFLF